MAALLSAVLAAGGTAALVAGPLRTAQATPAASAGAPAGVTTATGANPGPGATTDLPAVVAAVRNSVVTITSQGVSARGLVDIPSTGVGSGIVLTANGYILTNKHVVTGSQTLSVELADGEQFDATVVTESPDTDLALVKIDAKGLTPAVIGDVSTVQVGQTVIAIGSPLGTFTETVTKGILSATGRTITVRDEATGRPETLTGPAPDGRGDQPRQQRRAAPRRGRSGHRRQHRRLDERRGPRLRDPDHRRGVAHRPGDQRLGELTLASTDVSQARRRRPARHDRGARPADQLQDTRRPAARP